VPILNSWVDLPLRRAKISFTEALPCCLEIANRPLESVLVRSHLFLESESNRLLDCHGSPYGLKTSTEETKNKYPGFPTIYEQKSKLAMLEIWRVILNGSI
jgi:hypothetical protein